MIILQKKAKCGRVSLVERREANMRQLVALLREKPHTARSIAERLGVTKPTAYARVAQLALRGHKVDVQKVREAQSGPKALAYSIAA